MLIHTCVEQSSNVCRAARMLTRSPSPADTADTRSSQAQWGKLFDSKLAYTLRGVG